MRLGIFADIHGNLEALQAVIAAYKKEKIDRYICLGDVVGYGANPNECCQIVSSLADKTLIGNHDVACCGHFNIKWFNTTAQKAILWTQQHLSEKNLKWLNNLPYTCQEEKVIFSHGLPHKPEKFYYDDDLELIEDCYRELGTSPRISFMGHTHRSIVFVVENKGVKIRVDPQFKSTLRFQNKGKQYLLNVGSVGQPRDGDARACYAIYDTKQQVVVIKRVEYNTNLACLKIIDAGLPPVLGERLLLGI
ncbi:metallophosphoesterase [bacterium (candidate division B38) B3_B38]|nr:MAG: metallophosphoesterase [bacterium (candidate division B38) B3_B38]